MKLIFATNNQHKADEVNAVVGDSFRVITLKEAGIDIDIPEPFDTLEANASEKARVIYELTNTNCFSEDTGLEVKALNGEPGVKSARYAGDERSFDKNIDKLLQKLQDKADRSARFRAVISLIIDGKETLFEGICEGKIINERRGTQGFGYDPVFIPAGSAKTFGEMDLEEKTRFSHRKKATEKLVTFLNTLETVNKF
ncbi:MAG TPA: RdgB/HAM1 family non-canonical purine NTP pyrophosphatase [Chitinophagaceae bacterium]